MLHTIINDCKPVKMKTHFKWNFWNPNISLHFFSKIKLEHCFTDFWFCLCCNYMYIQWYFHVRNIITKENFLGLFCICCIGKFGKCTHVYFYKEVYNHTSVNLSLNWLMYDYARPNKITCVCIFLNFPFPHIQKESKEFDDAQIAKF